MFQDRNIWEAADNDTNKLPSKLFEVSNPAVCSWVTHLQGNLSVLG